MKKLAFFILLSLVTLGVSAQSNLKWNVNAGIGMSNWYGDDTDGTDAKFAYKVGIGLEVPFANTNIWSFQTGLNFISKGVKGDGVTDAWDVVDVTINQLYLELPLMVGARIHTASNFDLLFKGGPYLYNPQIQISAESGTKRSIFRQKNKTKRSKKRLHTTLIKPEQKVNEDLCSGFIVS